MTPATLLVLFAQYGPGVFAAGQRIVSLIEAGNKPLTAQDFADLEALASKTSADYLAEAQALVAPAKPAGT